MMILSMFDWEWSSSSKSCELGSRNTVAASREAHSMFALPFCVPFSRVPLETYQSQLVPPLSSTKHTPKSTFVFSILPQATSVSKAETDRNRRYKTSEINSGLFAVLIRMALDAYPLRPYTNSLSGVEKSAICPMCGRAFGGTIITKYTIRPMLIRRNPMSDPSTSISKAFQVFMTDAPRHAQA